MKYPHRIVVATIIATSLSSPFVHAEVTNGCHDLIKDCFVDALDQRDACIQTAAARSACTSSDLAELAAKRAQFGGTQQAPEEQGPAFLGPQIVNGRCVTNFDTALSAALVKGSLSKETIKSLSQALDECATSDSDALPRP